jgi:hypothetical protein
MIGKGNYSAPDNAYRAPMPPLASYFPGVAAGQGHDQPCTPEGDAALAKTLLESSFFSSMAKKVVVPPPRWKFWPPHVYHSDVVHHLNAPLKNPLILTDDESGKAPRYFLACSEMLVYFDPDRGWAAHLIISFDDHPSLYSNHWVAL